MLEGGKNMTSVHE